MITPEIKALISSAIREDIGDGDHTTLACIPKEIIRSAALMCKEDGILAGVELAEYIFRQFDESIQLSIIKNDGAKIKKGDVAFRVNGSAASILSAERLVLNCMQRMSGIATATNKLVKIAEKHNCGVLDTRKTTPNFRVFEKWAVKIGGGVNHRFGLYDMIMIKDNHIDYCGGISQALNACKKYLSINNKDLKIIVEARNLEEVGEILKHEGIHRILLDNFQPSDLKKALELIGDKCQTEASGGIDEKTIEIYAKTGVDFISVGAITHQINSLDMSLKAE